MKVLQKFQKIYKRANILRGDIFRKNFFGEVCFYYKKACNS